MSTTVLLLDPDPQVLHTVEAMLTALHCTVVPVTNCDSAEAASTAIRFDALMALDVPSLPSVEPLVAHVKEVNPSIKVITDEQAEGVVCLSQADSRLHKPFDLEDLRAALP